MRALAGRVREDPNDVEALVILARKLLRSQAFEEAQVLNQRALTVAPDNLDAQVNAAVLTSARGATAEALKELDGILEKNPQHAPAWFFRGMMGMQSGNQELAMQSWQKFVDVAPEGPQKQRIQGFLSGRGLQMPR